MHISPECKAFINKLLTFDFEKRITASLALNDPWILKYTKEEKVTEKAVCLSLMNLRKYRAQALLQCAVLSYIASQHMSPDEEKRIKQIFGTFDKDGDGKLTKEEFVIVLTEIYGSNKRINKEVDEIFKKMDPDNTGTIEYSSIF